LFNGTQWEQSSSSSPIYQTTVQPKNAAQLAHGQVHFGWNSTTPKFQLCPSNGPGGLIVDGQIYQVPSGCLTLAQSATTSSALNYFYAVHGAGDDLLVNNVVGDPSGKILLSFTGSVNGNVNDQVGISCDSIAGAIQANGSDTGTILGTNTIELNTPPPSLGTYSSGGTCYLLRLAASTTGHVTSGNGVQVKSDDPHYTLVGMCYIGPSNAVYDTNTRRDCASWYNRGLKTCVNAFTTDRTTTSTGYVELNPEIECEFVTWGTGDPMSQSDLSWSISGMMSNNTVGDGVAVTAGFEPSSALVEPEETASVNALAPVTGFPLAVRGSRTALSEGKCIVTLLGKAINGGTAKVYGTVPVTSLEVRVPQ
jgi:hypothetical protein